MAEETNSPATELIDHCCKTMKENEEFCIEMQMKLIEKL